MSVSREWVQNWQDEGATPGSVGALVRDWLRLDERVEALESELESLEHNADAAYKVAHDRGKASAIKLAIVELLMMFFVGMAVGSRCEGEPSDTDAQAEIDR